MIKNFKILYRYRELLWMWINREVRVRYKQSFLGMAWAIVQPLALMLAFTLVATLLKGVIETDGVPYPLFYYTALLPWTFFSTSVNKGATILINNLSLVVKNYFPREILPFAVVGAGLFDLMIAAVLFVGMLFVFGQSVTWMVLWVPLLLFLQVTLMLGILLFSSAVIVMYRDFRFIIPLSMQIMLFVTPIIYPVKMVPEKWKTLYLVLNPMSSFIDGYRRTLLYGQSPDLKFLAISGVISILTFIIGYRVFKKIEVTFADIM